MPEFFGLEPRAPLGRRRIRHEVVATPGYTDGKTYQLGNTDELGPFVDGFKRHVFSTTVRLVNPSGRGEAL